MCKEKRNPRARKDLNGLSQISYMQIRPIMLNKSNNLITCLHVNPTNRRNQLIQPIKRTQIKTHHNYYATIS